MNRNMPTGETMSEGSPYGQDSGGDEMAGGMEICVPLDSLKTPNENDQLETPEVGDQPVLTVEGTITRIEGNNAYIKPSAVNGQKIEQKETPMDEESQLRDMAAQQPL